MRFVEGGDYFRVDDDLIVYNQVGDEVANELTFVVNLMGLLLIAVHSSFLERDNEGIFVKLFIQTRLEGVENPHG